MTITVAMINYNNAAFLRQALDSVVTQTRLPDELIVSDDGSTDGSLELIGEYCARYPFVRLVKTPHNMGAAGNRDHAIRQASSRFVLNLDSDDWFEPQVVEKTLAALEAHPECLVISDFHVVDQSGALLHTIATTDFVMSSDPLQQLALRVRYMPGNQFALSKELYERLGGLDSSFRLYEDWEFFLRAAQAGCRWQHTGMVGFSYRKTGTGLSAAGQKKHMKYRLNVMRKALLNGAGRGTLVKGFLLLFLGKGFKYLSGKASPVGYN